MTPKTPIRVLIVDDSELFAEAIRTILQSDLERRFSVVGIVDDGKSAVALAAELRPDVITMDINMPVMDGLEAIARIMAYSPTPILVITGEPGGDELTFRAIERGALDLMQKPTDWPGTATEQESLRRKVWMLAGIPVVQHVDARVADRRQGRLTTTKKIRRSTLPVVAIAASTGGPAALARLLRPLPEDLPAAFLVVQHLSEGFCEGLARWLNDECLLDVHVSRPGEHVAPGAVLIAPDHKHMVLAADGEIRLESSPPVGGHRPAATVMMQSVARHQHRHAVGIILTGMQSDGALGMKAIHDAGGKTIAQDEATSVVFSMPQSAIELGAVDQVLPVDEIPKALGAALGITVVSDPTLPRLNDTGDFGLPDAAPADSPSRTSSSARLIPPGKPISGQHRTPSSGQLTPPRSSSSGRLTSARSGGPSSGRLQSSRSQSSGRLKPQHRNPSSSQSLTETPPSGGDHQLPPDVGHPTPPSPLRRTPRSGGIPPARRQTPSERAIDRPPPRPQAPPPSEKPPPGSDAWGTGEERDYRWPGWHPRRSPESPSDEETPLTPEDES